MWISYQLTTLPHADAAVDSGTVTIAGEMPGVLTRGEQRALPLFAPYGIVWQPAVGDHVLVLTDGDGGQCVVSAHDDTPPLPLSPHELLLYGRDCAIHLRDDGSILLKGNIQIQGNLVVNGVPYSSHSDD